VDRLQEEIKMPAAVPLCKRADLYVSLVMFAFSAAVFWQIVNINISDSRIMPSLVFLVSIVSATANLVQIVRKKDNIAEIGKFKLSTKELTVLALLFVCWYFIDILGFYSALFLLTLGISSVLWNLGTMRNVMAMMLYNVVLIIFTYMVFAIVFGMVMPKGVFIAMQQASK
jgi:hypothetical protein